MKRIKRKSLILSVIGLVLCLICLAGFAVGCGGNIPEYKFANDSYVDADNNLVNSQMTKGYFGEYHFPRSGKTGYLGEERQNEFVYYAEQIHKHLKLTQTVKVYVNYDVPSATDLAADKIYVAGAQHSKSVEMIAAYLQLIYGETANYGVVYGLAGVIYRDLKWGIPPNPKTQEDIKEFLTDENNRNVLDLNYGVFNERFFDKTCIEYAKNIAIKLVSYIVKAHGREAVEALLSVAADIDTGFDITYHEYLNEWLAEIGLDFKHDFNGVSIRFFSLNREYPINFITRHSTFYIKYDYYDRAVEPGLPDYYNGQFTYKFLKEYMTRQDAVSVNIKQFFDYDGDLKPKVYLSDRYTGGWTGFYATKETWLRSIFNLSLSYSYHIFLEKHGVNSSNWIWGPIYYCAQEYDEIFSNFYLYSFENKDTEPPAGYEKAYERYDIRFGQEEFCLKNIFYAYAFEAWLASEEFVLNNYMVSTAITYYIIEKHGKQKLFGCYQDGFEIIFGRTEKQFLDNFANFLKGIFW